MSLRLACVALACVFALGACAGPKIDPNDPTTAKEKQLREARAKGEVDPPDGQWAAWRYKGDRKNCFYVFKGRCFRTENAACQAAHCRRPKACAAIGGGPATMTCK